MIHPLRQHQATHALCTPQGRQICPYSHHRTMHRCLMGFLLAFAAGLGGIGYAAAVQSGDLLLLSSTGNKLLVRHGANVVCLLRHQCCCMLC